MTNAMEGVTQLAPGDSREGVPNVSWETRQAVVDLIRGVEPTTVLGLLIANAEPLTVEAMSGLLGLPLAQVEWTVEMLEGESLCARIRDDELIKVVPYAPYPTPTVSA